jgi:hypothetical protein
MRLVQEARKEDPELSVNQAKEQVQNATSSQPQRPPLPPRR